MKILEDLKELDKLSYESDKIDRKRTIYRRKLIKYIRKNIDNYPTDAYNYNKLQRNLNCHYTHEIKDDELILIVKKIIGPKLAIKVIKKIHEEGEYLIET